MTAAAGNSIFFLTTPRLGFRPWTDADFDLAWALWGDPRVTPFIGGPFGEQQVRDRLGREIAMQEADGIQYWPLFRLEDGAHVGCCGLRPYRGEPRVRELGFHLRFEHWAQGYASEAAHAVVTHAFERLGCEALFAAHHPKNAASGRVLERLGFERDGEDFYPPTGEMHLAYTMKSPVNRGPDTFDVIAHNREAWNREVEKGNPWTQPVSTEQITAARRGEWSVVLTPTKPVPQEWFGTLAGARVLCLASGGGQQAPILAAAGGRVTLLDNSPKQLARDDEVARRDGLDLKIELGEMTDLSRFADASFDLVFHPVSNLFIPDVRPLWREVARVLAPGGALLAGFANPALFLFDLDAESEPDAAPLVRFKLPYNDLTSLTPDQFARRRAALEPLEFSHSLEDQIGGQLEAGLTLTALFEDVFPGHAIDDWMPSFIATRSVKAR